MRAIRQSIVPCMFLFLLILSFAPAQAVGGSTGRRMSCMVRIRTDPAVMPLDFKTVHALLGTDAVAERAALEVLDAEPDQGPDFFGAVPLTASEPGVVLLALEVHLPTTSKAAAREFGDALIENLRVELDRAFGVQVKELQERLERGQDDVERAEKQFREACEQGTPDKGEIISLRPANAQVYRQLEQTVDFSALNREMSLDEAVRVLRHSVDPPLKVVVLWKDLLDNAEIKPTTQTGMDGPGTVQLETGLTALLNAVAGGFAQLDYVIEGGVLTVATIDSLPMKQMEAWVHRVPAPIRAMGQTRPLARLIMEAVEPESWFELSDFGEGTIRRAGEAELLIWQTRPNHQEIQHLLRQLAVASLTTLPVTASPEALGGQMHLLMSHRDKLQAELDSLQKDLAELERARDALEEKHSQNSWDDVRTDLLGIIEGLETLKTKSTNTTSDPPTADEIDKVIGKASSPLKKSVLLAMLCGREMVTALSSEKMVREDFPCR
jgi:hypothetical protein